MTVMPISSMGKLAQIRDILRTKRGDLVSRVPYFVFAATSSGIYRDKLKLASFSRITPFYFLLQHVFTP